MEILTLASGSTGNCYRVDDGKTPILIECGIPFNAIKQGLGFQLSKIVGCLASHAHLDHCKAAKEIMAAGIDCYMTQPTADAIGATGHRLQIIVPRQQFSIGSWQAMSFETEHDAPGSVGFLLQSGSGKLLFVTDTAYIRPRFKGLTHIMVECNYDLEILDENILSGAIPWSMRSRLISSHFGLDNVKQFLLSTDLDAVQEIHLIHVSEGNGDKEYFKSEIEKLTGKLVVV